MERLHHFGTTSNEHNHWTMNRRGNFTTHMRPDHTFLHLEYNMFLFNSVRAEQAATFPVSAEIQQRIRQVFAHVPGLPLAAVAQRGEVPFVLLYEKTVHVYSMQQYVENFGEVRNGDE
jgi:hypothetical protein